jgi:hypothetical protein
MTRLRSAIASSYAAIAVCTSEEDDDDDDDDVGDPAFESRWTAHWARCSASVNISREDGELRRPDSEREEGLVGDDLRSCCCCCCCWPLFLFLLLAFRRNLYGGGRRAYGGGGLDMYTVRWAALRTDELGGGSEE